jgi:hypothetical protein
MDFVSGTLRVDRAVVVAGRPKIPNKSKTLRIWEPLIGHSAAMAMYRGKWVLGVTPWVALGDFVLIWVVYGFSPSLAGKVAWVAGSLGVAFVASGFFFLWQSHRAASEALGVRITSTNAPPSDRSKYFEWCRQNGVRPLNTSVERGS